MQSPDLKFGYSIMSVTSGLDGWTICLSWIIIWQYSSNFIQPAA